MTPNKEFTSFKIIELDDNNIENTFNVNVINVSNDIIQNNNFIYQNNRNIEIIILLYVIILLLIIIIIKS